MLIKENCVKCIIEKYRSLEIYEQFYPRYRYKQALAFDNPICFQETASEAYRYMETYKVYL